MFSLSTLATVKVWDGGTYEHGNLHGLFPVLFVLSALPLIVPAFRRRGLICHQAWNLVVNELCARMLLRPSVSWWTLHDVIATAMLIGFGVGFSMLAIRKDRTHWSGWLSFAVFLCAFLVAVSRYRAILLE